MSNHDRDKSPQKTPQPEALSPDQMQIDEHAVRQALQAAEQNLPDDVTTRLAQARQAAVAAAQGNMASAPGKARNEALSGWADGWFSSWLVRGGVMAGGVVAALLITVAVLRGPEQTLLPLDSPELAAAQDLELLEDMEFVAWMMAMEESGEQPDAG